MWPVSSIILVGEVNVDRQTVLRDVEELRTELGLRLEVYRV